MRDEVRMAHVVPIFGGQRDCVQHLRVYINVRL
jgi:hypothetical protein